MGERRREEEAKHKPARPPSLRWKGDATCRRRNAFPNATARKSEEEEIPHRTQQQSAPGCETGSEQRSDEKGRPESPRSRITARHSQSCARSPSAKRPGGRRAERPTSPPLPRAIFRQAGRKGRGAGRATVDPGAAPLPRPDHRRLPPPPGRPQPHPRPPPRGSRPFPLPAMLGSRERPRRVGRARRYAAVPAVPRSGRPRGADGGGWRRGCGRLRSWGCPRSAPRSGPPPGSSTFKMAPGELGVTSLGGGAAGQGGRGGPARLP